MTSDVPAWSAFDPDVPPGLPEAGTASGRIVAIVASDGAIEEGWAGSVAVRMATSWTASGHRLVLADAGFAAPTVHAAAGIADGEGLADLLLWGSSVRRVAQRSEAFGIFVIPAGTAVSSGDEALRTSRWTALCAGFRDAGVTFAVLVPAAEPGLEPVLEQASDVVVLGGEDEAGAEWIGELGDRVLARVGRPVERAETPDVEVPAQEGLDQPVGEEEAVLEIEALAPDAEETPVQPEASSTSGDGPAREAENAIAPEEPGAEDGGASVGAMRPHTTSEEERHDPFPEVVGPPTPTFEELVEESETTPEPRPSGRRTTLLVLLLVVIVALIVAAWLGFVDIPGITSREGESATSMVEVPPAAAAEPAADAAESESETSPVLGFSVAVASYRDVADADELVAELERSVPNVLFVTTPVDVNGTVYHRVLAGPARDAADARAVRSLIGRETGDDASRWLIRPTPKAFLLDESMDRDAAERRVQDLRSMEVPAYVLAVDYSDGSTRYRVYAGAFIDEAESSVLARLLEAHGLTPTLAERTGRLPE
ncbi:MAG: SPOR domain-containing protein [Gemmatimonadota bacterium]|jgi:hypothetical protein